MSKRTITTPRRTWWFGAYATDSQLNDAEWYTELAERNAHVDAGLTGVLSGMVVGPRYVGTVLSPNLSVDVSVGAARDDSGWRLPVDVIANVLCDVDHLGASTAVAAGNHRALSIFAQFEDQASEIHAIKSGGNAYRIHDDGIDLVVYMGSETLLAAPLDLPPLMAGYVLLADVTLINGQTTITAPDLSTTRRQDLLGAATPNTPHAVRGFSLKAAVLAILGWLNTLIADLISIGPGTTSDGAGYVGAKAVASAPTSLAGATVRAQLDELLVATNARAALAGASFAGNISAPLVTGNVAMIPTGAQDIRLLGEAGQGACKNAAGTLQPFAVGVSTGTDQAITPRWVERAAATMGAAMALPHSAETDIVWTAQEYDSSSIFTPASADFVAPANGYYRATVYAIFDGDASQNRWALLRIYANGVLKSAANSFYVNYGDDQHICITADFYLAATQVCKATALQTNSATNATNINADSRMSFTRIG